SSSLLWFAGEENAGYSELLRLASSLNCSASLSSSIPKNKDRNLHFCSLLVNSFLLKASFR
ncbi:hypothetical protein EUTSA_v10022391mg, partial [Eutrema salsugineum]